ncbi:Maltose phosphorylase [Lactiplantibacillus plantarum subsp. plantarum]|uniref:Maltose phosphorylase n=1 Tax=Lactiplantibacillus plantarum subsp. plantarum TaxID=337330 RepID=A0A2S3U8D3_LACPN|nr:Maltose phosphorylase [Lactiplantibacillus plantarum subsp. plantarum]
MKMPNYDEQFWQVLDKSHAITGGSMFAETKPNDFGTPRFTLGMQMLHETSLRESTHRMLKKPSRTFSVAN